ncbi:MAG: hypothetical protein DHS20C13_00820 [Thermodesulfobacteriota bacterium]|nr:MAG: hypothetical protein DHS20C13_00820 [Thermodesulfobacteriota bacterium]
MENIRSKSSGKAKSFLDLSFIEKSITTIIPDKSSVNQNSKVTGGKFNKRSKKYFSDEYFYFAYRI